MTCITIKATTIKPEARSRGRVATSTRTIARGVRDDAHPAEIMRVMSMLFPLLREIPSWYLVRGVRYELLRIESRTVNGARIKRAVFKDEQAIRKAFAREMRRRHRAARKSEARTETRRRVAAASALLAMACAARYRRLAAARLAAQSPSRARSPRTLSAPTPRPLVSAPSS